MGASRGQLMQLDAVLRRRFKELAEKAERLAAAREPTDSGSFAIPAAPFYEWVTNVQNLLARAFGQESVHYQNFVRFANRFTSSEAEFANCRAVFVAAREDYEGGYLFNVRAAAKAEVLADALASAKSSLLPAPRIPPVCWLRWSWRSPSRSSPTSAALPRQAREGECGADPSRRLQQGQTEADRGLG